MRGTLLALNIPLLLFGFAIQGSADFLFRSSFENAQCSNGVVEEAEQCDDANVVETDGCTSLCRIAVVCDAASIPGADRYAVDPHNGNCYAAFDDESLTFTAASAACLAAGGHLATVTSASENAIVLSVQNPAQNPWIGAVDDVDTDDSVFTWVTGEQFGYSFFAPGEPDNDVALGGNADCLHLANPEGQWADTNCEISTLVVGRLCEFEP